MFKLIFKNMKAKDWVAFFGIFILTLFQIAFMMNIVSCIGLLTAAVQNSRTNGTDEILK